MIVSIAAIHGLANTLTDLQGWQPGNAMSVPTTYDKQLFFCNRNASQSSLLAVILVTLLTLSPWCLTSASTQKELELQPSVFRFVLAYGYREESVQRHTAEAGKR